MAAGSMSAAHKMQTLKSKHSGKSGSLKPKQLSLKSDDSGGDDPIHQLMSEEWRQGVAGVTEEGELEGIVSLCLCVRVVYCVYTHTHIHKYVHTYIHTYIYALSFNTSTCESQARVCHTYIKSHIHLNISRTDSRQAQICIIIHACVYSVSCYGFLSSGTAWC